MITMLLFGNHSYQGDLYHRVTLDSTVTEQRMDELRKPKYREVIANVSAYTHHEGGNVGAWGDLLEHGDCASDDLPYGTVIELPDGRTLVVRDRFGGGYKDRIDVYFEEDLEGALEFGRRSMEIKVMEE